MITYAEFRNIFDGFLKSRKIEKGIGKMASKPGTQDWSIIKLFPVSFETLLFPRSFLVSEGNNFWK